MGELVLTGLNNWAMPFIRYRVGDIGSVDTQQKCTCGRGLPLMSGIKGRITDMIIAGDGRMVHGEFFTHLFYNLPSIRQFQVLQEKVGEVRIRLVKEPQFDTNEVLNYLSRTLAGVSLIPEYEFVEEIPATDSGKFKFVHSKVAPSEIC